MTLIQLKQFIALAKAGSFVKAAETLHMTQPALSRTIKSLEDELGRPLFDRVGKRIELNSFGQDVLMRSHTLIEHAQQLKDCGRSLSSSDSGRIRLGLSSGPGAMLSTQLLCHFGNNFPNFHIEIVRSNTASLAQMLRDRLIDAAVLDIRALRPSPDLRVSQIVEMDGVFMCRSGHPLLRHKAINISDILRYPVASTPLSEETARIMVERYGECAHPDILVKLKSDEISHLVQVARQTDAVLLAIRASAEDLIELPIQPELGIKARFGLITVANKSEALFLPEIKRLIGKVMG
jgi:DNA-binding transcriptional LysR family regulator